MSLETSPSSTSSKSSASSTELRASISRLFQTAIDAQDVNLIAECDEAQTERNFSAAIAEGTGAEPIYAVVNLKKKYALRAQQKEIAESYCFRDRPNSVHVVSSDYEEVLVGLRRKVLAFVLNLVLFHPQVLQSEDCVDGSEEDENIYEPVGARFSYFTRSANQIHSFNLCSCFR